MTEVFPKTLGLCSFNGSYVTAGMNDSNFTSKRNNSGLFFFFAVSNGLTLSCNFKIRNSAFTDVIVLRNVTGELAGNATDPCYFHSMFRFGV